MASNASSEMNYYQAGIKVTKRRFSIHGKGSKNRPTSFGHHTHYGGGAATYSLPKDGPASRSTEHDSITCFDSDSSDDDPCNEEKDPEYAIRRFFFKALHSNKNAYLKRIYNHAMKTPKIAKKIFHPIENDYFISLSNFYTFCEQMVISINAEAFKICWLMHVSYWKANKRTPVTYIYVSQKEREQTAALGLTDLLEFIEEHHIQSKIPHTYYQCYGTYLPHGYENHEKGMKEAILDEYGVDPTFYYPAFTLPKKSSSSPTHRPTHRRSKSPITSPKDSTFHLFSDSPEPDASTSHLLEEHQKMLHERFGTDKMTGVEMDIASLE